MPLQCSIKGGWRDGVVDGVGCSEGGGEQVAAISYQWGGWWKRWRRDGYDDGSLLDCEGPGTVSSVSVTDYSSDTPKLGLYLHNRTGTAQRALTGTAQRTMASAGQTKWTTAEITTQTTAEITTQTTAETTAVLPPTLPPEDGMIHKKISP